MKNYNTKEKILVSAIVVVSVCIAAVLAMVVSFFLLELFLDNGNQSVNSQQVIEASGDQNLEVSRTQRMETLEVLRTDSGRHVAAPTQQEQHTILQALSQ